ncbi:MAG: prolyl oligopeptidase family serine peptidase [Longimicrobiales bacterium]
MRCVPPCPTVRLWFLPFLLLPVSRQAIAQAPSPQGFTIDDVLDVKSVSIADVSDDARWLVVVTRTVRDRIGIDNTRYGDPTYVAPALAGTRILDAQTGESWPLFENRRDVRTVAWSPDASRLAFVVREADVYRLGIRDRESGRTRYIDLPRDRILVTNGPLQWSADGRTLLFAMHTAAWQHDAHTRFLAQTDGPIIVQSSEDPFLSWEDLRRMQDRQIIATVDVASGRVEEALAEAILDDVSLTADGSTLRYAADITKGTNYDEIFGRESRIEVRSRTTGQPRTILESTTDITLRWSGDGHSYVYAKDGRTYYGTIDGGEAHKLTGLDEPAPGAEPAPEPADSAARREERERRRKERFSPVQLSWDGATLIASNPDGLWLIDTASGQRDMFHAVPVPEEGEEDEEPTSPRWSVAAWTRDARHIYLNYASRTAWERGLYRYDRTTKQLTELIRDDRSYSGVRVAADGSRMILTIANGNEPGDVYAADGELKNVRRLTDANPGLETRLSRSELIHYLDVDGRKLNGVLYYPLNYQTGTRYPTIFIVYETFFDDRFNSTVNLLTSNGYVVVQPSVHLEQGYPGEAWVKGVTAAANTLIDMGIADPDRLGVHGTSYGGYATNLLVTQTSRFAAAINISGKVDMISFYTDSPRLGTRNIHAPEKSQDRLGATLWEQPQKYIAHTAILAADRIQTPLLLMTGREDHNVPERTTSEMYYALRRLGKRVEWVSYVNGGHGMPTATVEETIDYHRRILDWYDRYLKKNGKTTATDATR